VPDYVRTLLRVIRESYGRCIFICAAGAEEESTPILAQRVCPSADARGVGSKNTHASCGPRPTAPLGDPLTRCSTRLPGAATHVVYKALESAAGADRRR